jgi:hypothetical protein
MHLVWQGAPPPAILGLVHCSQCGFPVAVFITCSPTVGDGVSRVSGSWKGCVILQIFWMGEKSQRAIAMVASALAGVD